MTTGEKIAKCRKEKGLKQTELAEMLGVTRQAVSRWESDLSFPETAQLLNMSKIFGCSVDWLLKYDEEERGAEGKGGGEQQNNLFTSLKNWHFEYKSKKTVGSLPLVHINIGLGRTAKGFFAVGIKSVGVFTVGVLTMGVFALGVLSLGLIALGALSLGLLLGLGSVTAGIFAAGGVAVGFIAFGGVAIGEFAFGGCAIGGYAFGGYANGSFVAIGDIACGGIALGGQSAEGSVYSATVPQFKQRSEEIYAQFKTLPQAFSVFNGWCKSLFEGVLNGRITLGGIVI